MASGEQFSGQIVDHNSGASGGNEGYPPPWTAPVPQGQSPLQPAPPPPFFWDSPNHGGPGDLGGPSNLGGGPGDLSDLTLGLRQRPECRISIGSSADTIADLDDPFCIGSPIHASSMSQLRDPAQEGVRSPAQESVGAKTPISSFTTQASGGGASSSPAGSCIPITSPGPIDECSKRYADDCSGGHGDKDGNGGNRGHDGHDGNDGNGGGNGISDTPPPAKRRRGRPLGSTNRPAALKAKTAKVIKTPRIPRNGKIPKTPQSSPSIPKPRGRPRKTPVIQSSDTATPAQSSPQVTPARAATAPTAPPAPPASAYRAVSGSSAGDAGAGPETQTPPTNYITIQRLAAEEIRLSELAIRASRWSDQMTGSTNNAAILDGALPQVWTHADEEQLLAGWNALPEPTREAILWPAHRRRQASPLWRVSRRNFGYSPEWLIHPQTRLAMTIESGPDGSGNMGSPPDQAADPDPDGDHDLKRGNLPWGVYLVDRLAIVLAHPFWEGDMATVALVLQFAVTCRTGAAGPWPETNMLGCKLLDMVHNLTGRARARVAAREALLEAHATTDATNVHPITKLLLRIASESQARPQPAGPRAGGPMHPVVDKESHHGQYVVTVPDLDLVITALDTAPAERLPAALYLQSALESIEELDLAHGWAFARTHALLNLARHRRKLQAD